MSSTFSEMISYLKPRLSESDYNSLNHDLYLRETSWNSQNDIHYHRIATLEGHNLAMSKELKDYSAERGELLLSNSNLEQKVTELNSELGTLKGELNDDYELKLAELKKEVEILNKQCLNWSKENRDLQEEIGKLGIREKELEQLKVDLESCKIVRGELLMSNIGLEQKVRDLKEEIGKLEARAKETANMYEKIKQNLELEKGKTVGLEKKKREAEEKYEAVLLAGTKKYYRVLEDEMGEIEQTGAELLSVTMRKEDNICAISEKKKREAEEKYESVLLTPKRRRERRRKKYRVLEDQMVEIEQTGAKLLSGPRAESSINVNEGQQTNAQETIPCLQKASITSPPIVELSDYDEDGEIKTPKRKLSSLEASENRSKQLKGSGPQADSSINVNEGQQTNAQETIPCLQKASITSPPIVELSDYDEDGEIKRPKCIRSSLEASENHSKQLKGSGPQADSSINVNEGQQTNAQETIPCLQKASITSPPIVELSDYDEDGEIKRPKCIRSSLEASENHSKQLKGSGPQADSSINVNEGQQTNAQETIPCLQKASITSPPIVELSDNDEDGEIKTPKRKLSSLEASENRSKQLKGSGKESVNASTSVAASHIGGTSLSLINEHEDAVQNDHSDQCWEYVADMLEALDKDIELCMKGVCALYQQHLNVFSRPRDVALAKFLVNGDEEGRLKRSAAELEKFDQYASNNCKKIAFNNSTLLFGMYKSKACRFFGP